MESNFAGQLDNDLTSEQRNNLRSAPFWIDSACINNDLRREIEATFDSVRAA